MTFLFKTLKIERNNVLPFFLYFVSFLTILFFYGVWPERLFAFPGSVDFGIPSISIRQLLYNDHLGYPFGSYSPEGLPYYSFQYLLCNIFSISEYLASQIVLAIVLLASFVGIVKLLTLFNVDTIVSIIMGLIFMLMPVNNGHIIGYPPLAQTMLLTPLFILIDLNFFKKVSDKSHLSKLASSFALMIISKVFAMFGNGYPFVFYNFISGFFLLGYLFNNKLINIKNSIFTCVGFIVSNVVALVLYKWYVPGGSFNVEGINYFRSQGIDIATLFLPSNNLFFFNKLNFSVSWNPAQFYGDGSNVEFNYLGFSFLILIGIGIYKRLYSSVLLKIALIAAIIALYISLGPSLKVYDIKQTYNVGEICYNMPEADATCSLGTSHLFQLPPFNNMRAVYRWIFVTKLLLIVLGGVTMTHLINRSKLGKLTFLFFTLIFIEITPNIQYSMHLSSTFYKMGLQFKEDVTDRLSPWLKRDKKVFFYSHENDFLARVMGNRYESFVYNVNGDKNFGLARAKWPSSILAIFNCKDKCNDFVFNAMQKGDLDVFIVPNFNLRWDFYTWPPQKAYNLPSGLKIGEYYNTMLHNNFFDFKDSRFVVDQEEYFSVITLSKSNRFNDKYDFCANFTQATFTNQGEMQSPWRKRIAVIPIDESSEQLGIFTSSEVEVIYDIAMPKDTNLNLSASVGYLPISQHWNKSDGTRTLILIYSGTDTDTVFNQYILPKDKFRNIKISLSKYKESSVRFIFKTTQDKNKNFDADWIFWQAPQISMN